ncbi:MAG TPA: hypothetical protein VJ913_11720 [Actinomycetota bacterium]|nr:hypothetical protein [Actinomycetota bacterium]
MSGPLLPPERGGHGDELQHVVHPAIVRGEAPNRIAAECFDESGGSVTLRLFVNGIPVSTVIDSAQPFQSGTIVVRAETRRGPMEAAFDDVLSPPPSAVSRADRLRQRADARRGRTAA